MKKKDNSGPVEYFAPLLNALKELGGSGQPDEVVDRIAEDLKIPNEIQSSLLPSGEPRFRNQIRWARLYLVREGYIDSSEYGVWKLTPTGLNTTLSFDTSKQIYQKWNHIFAQERRAKENSLVESKSISDEDVPPSDGYRSDFFALVKSLSPAGFERLAQLILRKAGFTQVVVTGKSGDGGIDGYGILQVNELVSQKVLFQCKKYQGSVTAGQIRDFRGALGGRSDKGILVTTGTFTADARKEATRDGVPAIELIDGGRLVEMLCRLELGFKKVTTYKIEEEFFKQFQAQQS